MAPYQTGTAGRNWAFVAPFLPSSILAGFCGNLEMCLVAVVCVVANLPNAGRCEVFRVLRETFEQCFCLMVQKIEQTLPENGPPPVAYVGRCCTFICVIRDSYLARNSK